jgi:DNA-binding LacI/PurR family transcriptional regulator
VKQLGISRGTLHRVLAGSPLVKASTRERVLRDLEKLHYTPNIIAQGLKTRRTKTIGIIGPAAIKMANIEKINALHLAAQKLGYSAIIGYSNGSAEEDAACIRDLRSRMVDGFVALGRGLPESAPLYQGLIDSGLPLVTLYPIEGLKTDCVYVNTEMAFNRLTSHLIGLGHRKIGLLLDSSASQYTVNREKGFRHAMKKASIPVQEDWVIRVSADGIPAATAADKERRLWQISDYQLGFWGTSVLLAKRDRPTALVCFSDEFAIGALRACDLAGVSVPGDLAITGYDDKEPAKFARVPLTTMHQPDEKVGQEAIALLVKRIETPQKKPAPRSLALEADLVVRESCGAAGK